MSGCSLRSGLSHGLSPLTGQGFRIEDAARVLMAFFNRASLEGKPVRGNLSGRHYIRNKSFGFAFERIGKLDERGSKNLPALGQKSLAPRSTRGRAVALQRESERIEAIQLRLKGVLEPVGVEQAPHPVPMPGPVEIDGEQEVDGVVRIDGTAGVAHTAQFTLIPPPVLDGLFSGSGKTESATSIYGYAADADSSPGKGRAI